MRKPLRRSRRHRLLAGVCGGIAESYGWSPTTVRVLWVLLGLLPILPGSVLYLLLWVLIPNENASTPQPAPQDGRTQ